MSRLSRLRPTCSPEQAGRKIVAERLVQRDHCGWRVFYNKYDHTGKRVKATHLGLHCDGYFCQRAKCQHVWAVEIYMAERDERIVLPHPFESHIPYLNECLQKDTHLRLLPFRRGPDTGWLIDDNAPEGVPISEWDDPTDIIPLISGVVEHAAETNAKIFIKIASTASDLIDVLLKKFHFRSIGRQRGVEFLRFDPQHVPDPYDGVPFGAELREFLDEQEDHIGRIGGLADIDEFKLSKRELLDKLRSSMDKKPRNSE